MSVVVVANYCVDAIYQMKTNSKTMNGLTVCQLTTKTMTKYMLIVIHIIRGHIELRAYRNNCDVEGPHLDDNAEQL